MAQTAGMDMRPRLARSADQAWCRYPEERLSREEALRGESEKEEMAERSSVDPLARLAGGREYKVIWDSAEF